MRSNLLKNLEGIDESRGRTEGAHPVYIRPEPILSGGGGGGGVIMTMTKVRSQFWIPTLRNPVKFIIRNFFTCNKYQASYYLDPKPKLLTKDRTKQSFPFLVIGADYKDPIFYCSRARKDWKAYILLFVRKLYI